VSEQWRADSGGNRGGCLISEEEFFEKAVEFLLEIGADLDGKTINPDTDLFADEILDSLGAVAFLDFLGECGAEEIPLEELDVEMISTLRNAYRLIGKN